MFKKLAELFAGRSARQDLAMTPDLAVAALLVHLAAIDGSFDEAERQHISAVLKTHFAVGEAEVATLIARARQKDADAVDFYQFTSVLVRLDMDQRLAIITMMWKVVFADRSNHELEDNMVWRVAELIGVSARDRTALRARIRAENQMESDDPAID